MHREPTHPLQHPPDRPRRPRRRWTGAGAALAMVLAVGLLASGCGGDSDADDAAAAGGGEPAVDGDPGLAYAECMRENGVPEFPDPQNGRIMVTPESGLDLGSPEFEAAREACQDLAPEGLGPGSGPNPEMEEQVLAFARCMRDNGIDFPDPDFSGGGVRLQSPDADPSSPEFQAAQDECSEHLQGLPRPGARSAP